MLAQVRDRIKWNASCLIYVYMAVSSRVNTVWYKLCCSIQSWLNLTLSPGGAF